MDLDRLYDKFQPYSVYLAGAFFGAGWWVWGDAVAVAEVNGEGFQPVFITPGIVATLAVLVMNCTSRSELSDSVYRDDAAMCRTRLTLFISYVFSVAAISAAVILLLNLKSQSEELWIGTAGILQSCLVVASGIIMWFFRGAADSSYDYM